MHQQIKKIKKFESKAFVIKKFLTKIQIKKIQKLYKNLPIEINNKRQKIIKKKWAISFLPKLQNIFKKN